MVFLATIIHLYNMLFLATITHVPSTRWGI
jgi:hypothetical protein